MTAGGARSTARLIAGAAPSRPWPRAARLTLREGTRGRAALELLAASLDGLTTVQCALLAGEQPGRRVLTRLGGVLRQAEAAGLAARAGTVPPGHGGNPLHVWVVTPAGQAALAVARKRAAEPAWAGDAERRARAGEPLAAIARRHGVSDTYVRDTLDRRGVPHWRGTPVPPWAAGAKSLYEAGYSSVQIARRYGVSSGTVLRELRKQGVRVRGPGQAGRARQARPDPPPATPGREAEPAPLPS